MEQPEDALSTYRSIIPEDGDQWVQLPKSHHFSQLHCKFWGVSMKDEETKWHQAQPPEPMDVDVDNQDSEEHEKVEDDIGPGSYILTLDVPNMQVSLWVRQEYIRVYNYCEDYLKAYKPSTLAPSVVITGQPGIGKSYWIYYAMRRYLAEKKPFIWCCNSATLFLFTKEGVFRAPHDFHHATLKAYVPTLTDSDHDTTGLPAHLAERESKYFIILTTSPNPGRWANIEKTKDIGTCTMNPWTKKEIEKSATIHGLAGDQRIYDMYDQYGPTARICFNFVNNPHARNLHEVKRTNALIKLSSATLREMIDDSKLFKMDFLSHTLILVRRMSKELTIIDPKDDYAKMVSAIQPRVELVSPAVEDKVRARLWEQTRAEKLQLYRQLANVESTRCIAGLAFEALAHHILQEGINIDLVPMVKKQSPQSGNGKKMPQWQTDRNAGRGIPCNIKPVGTKVYKGSSLDQIEAGLYYAPESKNQVAFDSFIMANGNLFIFQCSIGTDHPIKEGIISFFSQASLPPRANWYFIFVIPSDGSGIKCPQPRKVALKNLFAEMKLYTMTLDVSHNAT